MGGVSRGEGVNNPRWPRILLATAGEVMTEMTLRLPPHGQAKTSTSKQRRSREAPSYAGRVSAGAWKGTCAMAASDGGEGVVGWAAEDVSRMAAEVTCWRANAWPAKT